MELSKPGQTTAVPSGLAPSQQLSSDNQRPVFPSANWGIAPNRPNNTPASQSDRPRILMPWEQSSNTNPPRPDKLPNTPNNPSLNKRLPQMEVSPKPTAAKGAFKATNKRSIQQVEVSPKAQSGTAMESVRSKLRESLAAALAISTGEKTSEDTPQQNEEERANLSKEEGQNECESMVDELLQGNGLSWAENSQNTFDDNVLKAPLEDGKSLATKIEAELFRLFGGVNKKYKEKGRSLLFNLKDVNNPELRVRVLSGDIKPEKLCLMSAEELASRELSEWRQAKAHEMAQAIVLPDEDVDMRKRVKKTHKGEFVVIEDEKDSSWAPLEAEIKAGANVGASTGRVEQSVKEAKIEDEGSDLMLEIDFENVDHLSPVVTLDEFMKDLDSEPPFTDLVISNSEEAAALAASPEQTKSSIEKVEKSAMSSIEKVEKSAMSSIEKEEKSAASSIEKEEKSAASSIEKEEKSARSSTEKEEKSGAHSDSKDIGVPSGDAPGNVKLEGAAMTETLEDMEGKDASHDESLVKSDSVTSKLERGEALWEGVVQLNVSSLASVVALYKSGEKPSMKEWPGFIEIKGRVRLEPFEKFLKELPLSRTRAIMIVEIKWKEGSMESGRQNLSEIIESYITDARVGFAEPSPGVELYLSPTNEKMLEMFARLLPKEHSDNLKASTKSLVGVVVWRRPLVTTISPKAHSNHNQQSTANKKSNNNIRRKEQLINSNSPRPKSSFSARDPIKHAPSNNNHDNDDGDAPPGFGHMVNRADNTNSNNVSINNSTIRNYDDDLPEFVFDSGSKNGNRGVSSVVRPVHQIRELIQKYGQGTGSSGTVAGTGVSFKKPTIIETKPWNANDDDDDDIPEWKPNQGNMLHVNSLPCQPQVSPHNNMHPPQNTPQILAPHYAAPTQQILQTAQEPIVPHPTLRPPINTHPNYQATGQWWGQGGPGQVEMMRPPTHFGYRMPGTGWRPDIQENRGAQ